jgi:hypothetical protein
MARIRTIKPEFWDDDDIAALPRDARLMFIGTWNLADDEGLLRWTPEYVKASLFKYDDDVTTDVARDLMTTLEKSGQLFPYIGGRAGDRLAFVVNFRRHQKINRPQPAKLPVPSLQSRKVVEMYARRDRWTCHLCNGPIPERPVTPTTDSYDPRFVDTDAVRASPDHLKPKILGGTDEPSNIRASHAGCNKARGHRPIDQFRQPPLVAATLAEIFSESFSE